MPMNSKTTKPRTFHHEALAWRTAVQNNGGTVNATTLRAVSNFCTAINAAGIRSKFLRLNLVCGHNLAAARTPLYRGASATGTQYGSAVDTNVGPFTANDYSESTGITGDGNTKAFDTTLTLSTLTTAGLDYNNIHASVYTRGSNHGAVFGGGDQWGYYLYNYGLVLDAGNGGWHGQEAFTGNADNRYVRGTNSASGHKFGQDNNGTMAYWTNGVNSTGATNAGSPTSYDVSDSTPIWFSGMWNSYFNEAEQATIVQPYYATGPLAAYSVGPPLTSDASINAFYKAMQAFQTSLRRQV